MRGVARGGAGALVTFGIVPTAPETGFGYIQAEAGAGEACVVLRFVEKPDAATARRYLEQAAITGTAACSCSAPRVTSTNCGVPPDILDATARAFEAANAMAISCA